MKNKLFGNEIERMPDLAFRFMKVFFVFYYFFRPVSKYLKKFGIKKGDTVVDYGCGPGAFIREVSGMVGPDGRIYAVDIHEMAIESVENIIRKYGLGNVTTVLVKDKHASIPDKAADLIYALDMFHMVSDTESFLAELCRIAKPGGVLIIEDGHQPRDDSRKKIEASGKWKIVAGEKRFMKCSPVHVSAT